MPEVKIGDRVKVSFEGVVTEMADHDLCHKIVTVNGNGYNNGYNHYVYVGDDQVTIEHVEPAYEPGQMYVDANGLYVMRTSGGTWCWIGGSELEHDHPERPLTKLVPES